MMNRLLLLCLAVSACEISDSPGTGTVELEVEWELSSFIPRQGSDSLPRIYLDGTTDHPFVVDDYLFVDYKTNSFREEWHVLWFCSTNSMHGQEIEVNGRSLGPMKSANSWCPSEGLGSDGIPFNVRVSYPIVKSWCLEVRGGEVCK